MNFFSYNFLSHIYDNPRDNYYKNKSSSKFRIRDILDEYWEPFLERFPNLNIRDVVHQEVRKVRLCRTINLGYTVFECDYCDNYFVVPHTCKSRFCSSCGNRYVNTRVINSKHKIMKIKHRHIVFTIPSDLRDFFRRDRSLIDLLFSSVSETFNWIFNPSSYQNKQKKKPIYLRNKTISRVNKDSCLVPGFISVLHTYGRDLKWNPHIHVLITEGGLTNKLMKFKKYTHFNYESLRKTFQKILLDKLYNHIGSSFYKIKCRLYRQHNNGFYVYAHPKQFRNIKNGVEYIMRYSGKPAMAESRIINVDYSNDSITYWYDDHKTNKRITITEHIFDFIKKIIIHIPNKNFKTIRYYGLYSAKNHKYSDYFIRLYKLEEIKSLKKKNTWRHNLISHFRFDPIMCECGNIMIKSYACIPIKESEDEWYEVRFKKEKRPKYANWEHFTRYSPNRY